MSLLLVPAQRENLEKSIENSVDVDFVTKYLGDEFVSDLIRQSGNEGIRCWAVTASRFNLFTHIMNGDEVLLTETGTGLFTHYGVVIGKIQNANLGEALWSFTGENPWEYIYFLANIQRIQIEKKELVVQLGYKESFPVYGSIMANDDKYADIGRISEKYEIPVFEHIAENAESKDYSAEDIQSVGARRQGHYKFSRQVKENYGHECAICGVTETEFLVAGHISTWAKDKDNRLNPSNGICLCSLHDKAFEHGYIALDEKFKIIISEKLDKNSILFKELVRFKQKQINIPKESPPDIELLRSHRRKHNFAL